MLTLPARSLGISDVHYAKKLVQHVDQPMASLLPRLMRMARSGGNPLALQPRLLPTIRTAYRQTYDRLYSGLLRISRARYQDARQTVANRLTRKQIARLQVKEDLSREVLDWLFPALLPEEIAAIVFRGDGGVSWVNRFLAATKLATPEAVTSTIINSLSQGKSYKELERDLMPVVGNVRSTAKRLARTEGVRVAHETQMEAWDNLGEMVVGFQIHSTPNENSRTWHQKRSGTIYYKEPKAGQKGLYQMPRPPLEAADPAERPANTPETAWNCLCYLSPVLRE